MAIASDLDRDGDTDLAWAGRDTSSVIMHNDGRGNFSVHQLLPLTAVTDLACGDLDGDGYPDLVFTCDGYEDRLFRNDRTGSFQDRSDLLAQRKTRPETTWGVTIADVDLDGDLDLLFSNGWPYPSQRGPRIWLNDGTGRFQDVTSTALEGQLTPSQYWYSVRAADVDGDGDVDLLSTLAETSYSRALWTFTNLTRHVHVPSSVARNTALPLTLDAQANHVVVPLIGRPGPLVTLPGLGGLGLDPSGFVALPARVFLTPATQTVPLWVPNDPSLGGVTLRAQAVDLFQVATGTTARLTNWLPFTIQR